MLRHVAAPLVTALVAGCVIGPDYRRPDVTAPQAFRYEPQQVADTIDTEWWKQFNDPVLDQLIAEALAGNKTVKIAVANVEQAAGVLTQTRAPLFPQLSYQAAAARQRSSKLSATPLPSNIPNPTDVYQLGGAASWEIDLWGRVRRLSEAAQANVLATEEARRGVILSLVAQVATTYIQLRGLDEQLAIAQRTLEAYKASVDLFELQFQHGQTSELSVAQAESRYEAAAAEIPQIRAQIVQTEIALSILLGRDPGPIARGKSVLELTLPTVPSGLPSQLLLRRPDLLQAEQQLVAANAQIGAARALYFPTISLTGSLGTLSTAFSDLFKSNTNTWNYTGSVIGPIFTAGAISGQVEQAKAGRKAALLSYQLAIQTAFGDVEGTLWSREQLIEQVAAQERRVKALTVYRERAQELFDGGYTSYVTVLQAEQELFPEELNLATFRAQLFVSLVNIYRAMGGGWVDAADKLTPVSGATQAGESGSPR